ncbi:MAG TPA: electron transport complex subunit E [Candidatus Sumerlaeota bacterium]|nr:MAG: Electron transport complex protein RnfE [candidate division BRC1 bacterium ADurb.Bin183]HOE64783.1 electron transport complex subunit E [Candidatus Sumerlaeota bacterium]HRR31563.1 electron transport complex subunit E [Candidatus Sumerlaeia bacterium]HON50858.1 electron transport complex subunit E [Candidatus Sumerlaeota bacterium]HOR65552.1 electron transport complex subunit E [Candidatus Sumerlaeota bacterium]
MSGKLLGEFTKGLWKEHPIFRIVLGMCPTLAISNQAINAIGMGISVIFVLTCSNVVISLMRKITPDKIRIPLFIVVISTFVTVTDLTLHAVAPAVWTALGIFIPLIVVNCIIIGRAEAFAQKSDVLVSALDGIGMGLGFTWGLLAIGTVREILGGGTWFGIQVLGKETSTAIMMILPAGGFITLGIILAAMNKIESLKAARQSHAA